ncbi:MAG: nuclear transport factor 2 family protein [Chitinophagales bacterium]|nr:nuclear transport factor 2 family protein [Hyphomicrobiales bacterium]
MTEPTKITAQMEQPPVALTRRTAILVGVATVFSCAFSLDTIGGEDAVGTLIKLAEEKNAAFMRGDMNRWAEMTNFTSDFTLMQPFGGAASHGFDKKQEKLAEMSRFFRSGEAKLEVIQTYSSRDFVVLVMIERQTAEVGGLSKQDWSLRVTEVYRKVGSEWQLAHRHADPLVQRLTLDQTAAIARGQ